MNHCSAVHCLQHIWPGHYQIVYLFRFGTVGETEKREEEGSTKDSVTESKPSAERFLSGRLNSQMDSGGQSAVFTSQPTSDLKGSMPEDPRQNKR